MQFWDICSTFVAEMNRFQSFILSSGARNVMKLLSANVVAQVIGLVVYPFLTRIYSPEDFGLLNLFLSIGNVLVVLSVADYYYSIVLPKDERHAIALVYVSLIPLILTTLIILISILFAKQISNLFNSPNLVDYYWLLPIYVLVIGLWNILNYWYIRQKKFGSISAYQISQNILSSGGKMVLGYEGILQGGMIYSVVLAPILSLGVSILFRFRSTLRPLLHVSRSDIIDMGKKYRNFPMYVLPRSLVNVISGQLPVLLLTPFFGGKFVGLFSMALLLGYMPIGTISRALYQVMYQHTTENVHNAHRIGKVYWRFIGYTSLVIIPLFALLYFILPDITAWLLGDNWRIAGEYIRWMLPWLYMSLLTGSVCYLSDVFMQQKKGLFFEILLFVSRIGGLVLGVWYNDFTLAVASYSIGTALAILAQLLWLSYLVRRYDNGLSTN